MSRLPVASFLAGFATLVLAGCHAAPAGTALPEAEPSAYGPDAGATRNPAHLGGHPARGDGATPRPGLQPPGVGLTPALTPVVR